LYDVCFPSLIEIIYQRDKVYYFNKNVIFNDDNKCIDWVDTMFRKLHRKLVRWTTFHTKMLKCMVKTDFKMNVCHFEFLIEVLILYIFLENNPQIQTMLEPTKAQQSSTSKATTSKLKDRFPKNKCPLRLFNRSLISKDESRTRKA
jgi:hypothetical protein